jgi:hypothetical protein
MADFSPLWPFAVEKDEKEKAEAESSDEESEDDEGDDDRDDEKPSGGKGSVAASAAPKTKLASFTDILVEVFC